MAGPVPRLLGDIGGTRVRLAWQAGPGAPLRDERHYLTAQFPGITEVVERYLADTGCPRPLRACLGIADPVSGDTVAMTNHPWRFSIHQVQVQLGLQQFRVINDFAALALALPDLSPQQLHPLGAGRPVAGEPCAVLGPGTGLGMATLVPIHGHWLALAGEGGHATLPASTELEWQVLQQMAWRFGHVSAERVLSGPGLIHLHEALATVRGWAQGAAYRDAAAITQAATTGDSHALETVQLFAAFLGTVAGNLALTVGARGGVYIGGGIAPRIVPLLQSSSLRERFEAKGRFRAYLQAIPLWVITASAAPALLGAARALDTPPQ